jgi:hypothetical protein
MLVRLPVQKTDQKSLKNSLYSQSNKVPNNGTLTNTEDLENLTFIYEKFTFKYEAIKRCTAICKSNELHYTKI